MTEREAIVAWDARTPLERLMSLSRQEQGAFLALFAGGRTELQGFWRSDTEEEMMPSFGKAECEWVDFRKVWCGKLPGLRLIQIEEGPRKCALGSFPGSAVWPITITITEDGWSAREAYWEGVHSSRGDHLSKPEQD